MSDLHWSVKACVCGCLAAAVPVRSYAADPHNILRGVIGTFHTGKSDSFSTGRRWRELPRQNDQPLICLIHFLGGPWAIPVGKVPPLFQIEQESSSKYWGNSWESPWGAHSRGQWPVEVSDQWKTVTSWRQLPVEVISYYQWPDT